MDASSYRSRRPRSSYSSGEAHSINDSQLPQRSFKRLKLIGDGSESNSRQLVPCRQSESETGGVTNYSDPFSLNLLKDLDPEKYGSVTEDISEFLLRRKKLLDSIPKNALSPVTGRNGRNDVLAITTEVEATPVVIDLSDDDDIPDDDNLSDDQEDQGTFFTLRRTDPVMQNSDCVVPVSIVPYDDNIQNDPSQHTIMAVPYQAEISKNRIVQYDDDIQAETSKNPIMAALDVITLSDDDDVGERENISYASQQVDSKTTSNNCVVKNVGNEILPPLYLELKPRKPSRNLPSKEFSKNNLCQISGKGNALVSGGTESGNDESMKLKSQKGESQNDEFEHDYGTYIGTDDDIQMEDEGLNFDGLGDIWDEMKVALECSKDATEDAMCQNHEHEGEEEEDCEHSFILKDDIGEVCRICGVIRRKIDSIIEYNFSKGRRSTRTYSSYERESTREINNSDNTPCIKLNSNFASADINPHPRHSKEMKPHQVEGFNFLLSNLVTDNPGGCILAHAPGSGKTFMIISFLQSFMAKYPEARPLIILPKGILAIWRKEFQRWQIEDIPLYDFYSAKADNRQQQLAVLKKWKNQRSVLLLGYQQFSCIVSDPDDSEVAVSCQNYLLKIPTILILDEGHTPRNQDTDNFTSLERVETKRKVVLSGTLYQNHVAEVFNILNLVRPRFLKMETSKEIKRRILSRAQLSGRSNIGKTCTDSEFYSIVENTLSKDTNLTRKVTVIQDLREMSKSVLHYYKGDSLDELPGLVDLSVFLRLSPKQAKEVEQFKLLNKFAINAQGGALYVHPNLRSLFKKVGAKDRDDEKIDEILEDFDEREGVKANFYLNLLNLCESSNEKVLVFSQYLLPLNFLARLTAKIKGYSIGREMFMITGDSDADMREISMEKFNKSPEARVFFGSIKACGEGISLVGASRIIILDVHVNPSVTRQAIGRAFRPGQVRKVYTYRLVASESPEENDHDTCFRKESIAKLWFEWDESSGNEKLEMEKIGVDECGDFFLETGRLSEDVINVYKW